MIRRRIQRLSSTNSLLQGDSREVTVHFHASKRARLKKVVSTGESGGPGRISRKHDLCLCPSSHEKQQEYRAFLPLLQSRVFQRLALTFKVSGGSASLSVVPYTNFRRWYIPQHIFLTIYTWNEFGATISSVALDRLDNKRLYLNHSKNSSLPPCFLALQKSDIHCIIRCRRYPI